MPTVNVDEATERVIYPQETIGLSGKEDRFVGISKKNSTIRRNGLGVGWINMC